MTSERKFIVELSEFSALELPAKDISGTSDPYIKIIWDKLEPIKSYHIKRSLNPIWSDFAEKFDYFSTLDSLKDKYVVIEVWDKDRLRDDFIGDVKVDLASLAAGPTRIELQLMHRGSSTGIIRGTIRIAEESTVKLKIEKIEFSGLSLVQGHEPNPYISLTPSCAPDVSLTSHKGSSSSAVFTDFRELEITAANDDLLRSSIRGKILDDHLQVGFQLAHFEIPVEFYNSSDSNKEVIFYREVRDFGSSNVSICIWLKWSNFPTLHQMPSGKRKNRVIYGGILAVEQAIVPEISFKPPLERPRQNPLLSSTLPSQDISQAPKFSPNNIRTGSAPIPRLASPNYHHQPAFPQAAPTANFYNSNIPQAVPTVQFHQPDFPQAAPTAQFYNSNFPQAAPTAQFYQPDFPQAAPTAQFHQPDFPQAAPTALFYNSNFPQAAPTAQFYQPDFPQAAPTAHFYHSNFPQVSPAAPVYHSNLPQAASSSQFDHSNSPQVAPTAHLDQSDISRASNPNLPQAATTTLLYHTDSPQGTLTTQECHVAPSAPVDLGDDSQANEGEAPLPQGWEEKIDPKSGKTYYADNFLKKTQWNRPDPLPEGFERAYDKKSKKVYYKDMVAKKTMWKLPSSTSHGK